MVGGVMAVKVGMGMGVVAVDRDGMVDAVGGRRGC